MALQLRSGLTLLALVAMGWSLSFGQAVPLESSLVPEPQAPGSPSGQPSEQPSKGVSGTITGTVIDQTGALVFGARVTLTRENSIPSQQVMTGADGQFSFPRIASGPFHLAITSEGFGVQNFSGTLDPGESETVPPIMLAVAMNVTEVEVGIPRIEIAAEQIKIEEKQRVLGAIPNFYVSYIHNAVPLSPSQKFALAWKTMIDPFTFVVVAGTAGVEQAQNHFRAYGQGAEGYGKRFGAVYADTASSTFIGGAILPSLLKQDPRYFYKGTGSKPSRMFYAIANAVICKGDNGRWQANYSDILGNLAAGGISNLYYPAGDREGAQLTFENAGIGIGTTALTNVLQEFLIRKLTPKRNVRTPSQP